MDTPNTYIEIYLYADNQKMLQSRVVDDKTLTEVIEEIRGQRFDLLLICNRCVVGSGTYRNVDDRVVIEHEDGACIGFLDRYLYA
jgi:hypothetical protein